MLNPLNPAPSGGGECGVEPTTTTATTTTAGSTAAAAAGATPSSMTSTSGQPTDLTPDYIACKDEKISLTNVLSVSTSLSNINTITGSLLAGGGGDSNHQSTVGTTSSTTGSTTNANAAAATTSQAATATYQQAISALGLAAPAGYTKSYFDLRLRLVSTVHTQDVYLERFIGVANAHCLELSRAAATGCYVTTTTSESLLRQCMNDLCFVEPETFVKFLFIILDKLLYLMITVRVYSSTFFNPLYLYKSYTQ